MENLNTIQRFYFDQIKSDKLKQLIESSYSFLTMEDSEKLDILILASVSHSDPNAEKDLIKIFEKEQQEAQKAIDSIQPLTPQTAIQQTKVIDEESAEYEENISKLKRIMLQDKEEKEQKGTEKTVNALEEILENLN